MSSQSISIGTGTVESEFLTRVMRLDAVASGSLGVLLLAAGWALDGPLGLPVALSAGAGAFLVLWATALLLTARRSAMKRTRVTEVIAVNVLWVIAGIGLVFLLDLSALGTAFVLVQSAAVGLFAELQLTALRKAR